MTRAWLRRIVAITALVTVVLGSGIISAPPAAALSRREKQLARLINAERHDRQINRMRKNGKLNRYAQQNSNHMASRNQVGHFTNLQQVAQDVHCRGVQENVVSGNSPRDVFDRWMDSSIHRSQMLNPANDKMGIGIKVENGKLWSTGIFCDSA
jgi:uncharacterized protein YkwD